MTKLTPDKLRQIVRDYVKKGWNFDPVVNDPHEVDQQYELTEDRIAELKEDLVVNWPHTGRIIGRLDANGKMVRKPWKDWLIEDYNFQGLDEDSKTLFAREMVKAEIKLLEVRLEKLKGNYDERQLDEILKALGVQPDPPVVVAAPEPMSQPEVTSISLADLIEDFWEDRVESWKPRTLVEYERIREHVLKHIDPDTQVHTLTHGRMKEYRQVLQDQKLSVSRVNLYIGFINSVFLHGMRAGYMQINPTGALKLKDKRKKHTLRDSFEIDELKLMFESTFYQADGFDSAYKFWVPLLALFTGCRMEEICQLRVSQVIQEGDIWCLKIAKEYPDQSVKTSEDRIVPLHPFLIEQLGFHLFARGKEPDDRLFTDLNRINNRWGHYVSRHFTVFKKHCGVTNPKVSFHSFRHLMETTLQGLEVNQRVINQLLGHSEKGEHARYGKPNIPLIYERAVMSLPWPEKLALDKVQSRWVGKA